MISGGFGRKKEDTMERFIAVDNVCAWPNLTRLPDGTILATLFNQPTHGGWEGDVECWASVDDGRTWALRGVPAPHEPTTNRMNEASGLARDGSLIVIASGWSLRNPIGDYSSPHDGKVLPNWVCRSSDGGATWSHEETVTCPEDMGFGCVPFGDIVQQTDGTLGVCVYSRTAGEGNQSCYFSSEDDGHSWSRKSTIEGTISNETTPLVLPDGSILVAARTTIEQHLELYRSADQGQTWQAQGPLTLFGQIPGHLLGLSDGRILLSYGLRNKGLHGVATRVSDDGGQTWSAPRIIVNYGRDADGGYPSSVQCADGTIVTAYYCAGIETHQRYHMGVVRWTID